MSINSYVMTLPTSKIGDTAIATDVLHTFHGYIQT